MTTTAASGGATSPRKRLIIVGAGFAGINLAKRLRRVPALDIILVDRHNYHLFQPLLYQVATAALSPADIAHPIRRIFRNHQNVRVVLGEVERVDLAARQVCGGDVCVDYDYLALCVGATHSYFGKREEWHRLAPGLKDLDDATEIRRRVLLAFEEAELEQDEASRRAKLTFVVIGGGPTGVEMAGALREIAAQDIQKDFRNIDTGTSRIILLQGGDRLLPAFPQELSERAKHDLEAMGVQVRLKARVTEVQDGGVWIGQEFLAASNVVWAAGVEAPKLLGTLGVETDKSGRVIVGPDLSVPGHPNVFVLGDAAAATDVKSGQPIPGLAPAAMQMGHYVGGIIRNEMSGGGGGASSTRPPFHYRDKGTMATIGTRRAVADVRGWKFTGVVAWLMWSLIHVMFLIGFRSKLFVMAGWIYDYLTNGREARLITGNFKLHVREPRGGRSHVHVRRTGSGTAADDPAAVAAAGDGKPEGFAD